MNVLPNIKYLVFPADFSTKNVKNGSDFVMRL